LIINRYVVREIVYTFLGLSALLILIYISNRFMLYLVQAASGKIPADFVLRLLVLKLLSDLMLILPLAFFLSILLALGRMYKDNEITVMAACGIPIPLKSIVHLGIVIALGIGTLSLFIAPWAQSQRSQLQAQLNTRADIFGIAAGRFKEFNQGQGIFYVEDIEPESGKMQTLFAQTWLPEKQVVFSAKRAYRKIEQGELVMVLEDGYRYENKPSQLNYTRTHFLEHTITIPQPADFVRADSRDALPTTTLLNSNDLVHQAELQWRLSLPISVILLAALAVPLSRTTPRQGQYSKIFIGILISLIYNNVLNIAQKWLSRGDVPPWIGVWWVHTLMLIFILVLWFMPQFNRYFFGQRAVNHA